MATTTTAMITNLQEKVIGPARLTLKDDVLAIKSSFKVVTGRPGMDDTYNSPKLPGVTAFGLSEDVDMATEALVDSNVAISATEVGVAVRVTNKMLRTISRDEFLRNVGKAMGSAINVKVEQDLATLIDGFSGTVGLDGASGAIAQLQNALGRLRNATEPLNSEMMRQVSAVVLPYLWNDLSLQFYPSGSGEAHSPNTAPPPSVGEKALRSYMPDGTYFGTPIKVSSNLVTSSGNGRSGVFHRDSGCMYDFMPVDMETDDSDKSMRSVELVMVTDYGYAEILDGHGLEWDHDNSAPTS